MRRLLTILAASAMLTAAPAAAQSAMEEATCGSRADVTEKLQARFGEFQKGAGLVSDNRVLELWQSAKTGSWTILMTRPDGKTCILAAGQHWRDRKTGDPT